MTNINRKQFLSMAGVSAESQLSGAQVYREMQ